MKQRKDFKTQKEFIRYLIANKSDLIQLKKAAIKFTDSFAVNNSVEKNIATHYPDDIESGVIKRTIIANTYNWLDSHDDVHIENVFERSIKNNSDKVFHLHDHKREVTAKVGKPTSIYEKSISWKDLGVNIEGKTMSLFLDSDIIKELNPAIFNQYFRKEINQHSVGMQYVTLDLAANDENNKDEFATWGKYFNRIGNKEKAIEQGYFWAVTEAKLLEVSAVLVGSNELTPTVENIVESPEKKKEERISYWRKLASAK